MILTMFLAIGYNGVSNENQLVTEAYIVFQEGEKRRDRPLHPRFKFPAVCVR